MTNQEKDFRELSTRGAVHNKTILGSLIIILITLFLLLIVVLFTLGSRVTALEKDCERLTKDTERIEYTLARKASIAYSER